MCIRDSHTTLASVSSIHLDEQGDVAGAAAMAMLIVYVSIFVRVIHAIITKESSKKLRHGAMALKEKS